MAAPRGNDYSWVNEALFWPQVDKTATCWLWTDRLDPNGYGRFRNKLAHRISFFLTHGHLGEPWQTDLDHLCRVRNCVNPDHLEPVTHAENLFRARRIECQRGHDLTIPENMRFAAGTNKRVRHGCMVCERARRPSRVPIVEGDGDPRHGTSNGYKLTCRCDPCRLAHNADCLRRYHARRNRAEAA